MIIYKDSAFLHVVKARQQINKSRFSWGRITDAQVNGGTFPVAGQPGPAHDERSWDVTAAGRFGNAVAYTSYRDNGAAQGSNFVINMVAGVPTAVLPQTGLVRYRLLGGAAPTEQGLAAGTEGYFTGNLGVAFGGASPRVGLDFEVASNGTTFASGTTGGAANPLSGGLTVDGASRFRGLLPAQAIAGTGCTRANACVSYIEGGLFGEGAGYAGLVYFLNDASDLAAIRFVSGSAVFGTEGTALPSLGTLPDSGGGGTDPFGPGGPTLAYTGGFVTAGTGLFARSASFNPFSDPGTLPNVVTVTTQGTALEAVLDSTGGLARYRTRVGAIFDVYDRGTAQQFDVSGNADVLIGHWSNGSYIDQPSAGALPTNRALTANQGFHYMLSDGFTGPSDFPMRRVEYQLLAATRPTIIDGSLAPGTFTAAAAITFGAMPTLAIEGQIALEGLTYSFATPRGRGGRRQPDQYQQSGRFYAGRLLRLFCPGPDQ